jgi:hypothetical protein
MLNLISQFLLGHRERKDKDIDNIVILVMEHKSKLKKGHENGKKVT